MSLTGNKLHLILSPHFDDAVLSLGDFISENIHDIIVVTVFAGAPQVVKHTSWDKRCGFKDSTGAIMARVTENNNALNLLRLFDEQIKNLSYLDKQYRLSYKKESILGLRKRLRNKIAKDVLTICNGFKEKEIAIYAPLFNSHSDHHLVRDLLLLIRKHLQKNNTRFFIYQDMPYAYRFMTKAKSSDFSDIDDHLKTILPKVSLKIAPIIISKETHNKKIGALRCYTSQLEPLAARNRPVIETLESFSKEQAQFIGYTDYVEVMYEIY